MYFLEWNKDYESKIALIDSQHKALFKEINTFYIKCKFGHSKEAAKEFMNFFENFALSHFQTEEAFQRENRYPLANEHEAKHDYIKIQAKQLIMKYEHSRYSDEVLDDIEKFISTYLIEHINDADMHFIKYLRNRRAQK